MLIYFYSNMLANTENNNRTTTTTTELEDDTVKEKSFLSPSLLPFSLCYTQAERRKEKQGEFFFSLSVAVPTKKKELIMGTQSKEW